MCGNSIKRQFIAAGMLLFKMLTQSILSKEFFFFFFCQKSALVF